MKLVAGTRACPAKRDMVSPRRRAASCGPRRKPWDKDELEISSKPRQGRHHHDGPSGILMSPLPWLTHYSHGFRRGPHDVAPSGACIYALAPLFSYPWSEGLLTGSRGRKNLQLKNSKTINLWLLTVDPCRGLAQPHVALALAPIPATSKEAHPPANCPTRCSAGDPFATPGRHRSRCRRG
jgi:hypothetical protein